MLLLANWLLISFISSIRYKWTVTKNIPFFHSLPHKISIVSNSNILIDILIFTYRFVLNKLEMYLCSQNNHYKRPFNENIIRDYCNYQCKEMAIEIYLAKVPSLAHNMHKTPNQSSSDRWTGISPKF